MRVIGWIVVIVDGRAAREAMIGEVHRGLGFVGVELMVVILVDC